MPLIFSSTTIIQQKLKSTWCIIAFIRLVNMSICPKECLGNVTITNLELKQYGISETNVSLYIYGIQCIIFQWLRKSMINLTSVNGMCTMKLQLVQKLHNHRFHVKSSETLFMTLTIHTTKGPRLRYLLQWLTNLLGYFSLDNGNYILKK